MSHLLGLGKVRWYIIKIGCGCYGLLELLLIVRYLAVGSLVHGGGYSLVRSTGMCAVAAYISGMLAQSFRCLFASIIYFTVIFLNGLQFV